MLGDKDVAATIAVKDLNVAKEFYEGKLGLKLEQQSPAGDLYKSGNCKLFVYPSGYAGTNQATYASWKVEDVEGVVAELKSKGIVFEQYDNLPGTTREGDVHVMGDNKAVWFKDPDGNILSFGNM